MIETLTFFLEWALRVFGAFWVLGGALTLQQARMAGFMDTAIEAITQEKEDRLVSRFLFISALLTLVSGAGLALASRWALFPLVLLIVSQGLYFAIQAQRYAQAYTDEERLEAQITKATRNAFIVSLVVALAAVVGVKVGALQ